MCIVEMQIPIHIAKDVQDEQPLIVEFNTKYYAKYDVFRLENGDNFTVIATPEKTESGTYRYKVEPNQKVDFDLLKEGAITFYKTNILFTKNFKNG